MDRIKILFENQEATSYIPENDNLNSCLTTQNEIKIEVNILTKDQKHIFLRDNSTFLVVINSSLTPSQEA